MRKWLLLTVIVFVSSLSACSKTTDSNGGDDTNKTIDFKFLQLNLWVECTKVTDAPQYLIEQIASIKPDVATFCELYKGDGDDPVLPKLISGLKARGLTYYSARIDGRAVISKYPIYAKERINQWMFKAILNVKNQRVAVYATHSEYRYYTCYYPRGYNDGSVDWNKLPAPITDVDTILSVCEKSDRIASAQNFIDDAKEELAQGALVFYAGDLNEPSYLDWQEDMKNLYEHNGCVVNWGTSKLITENGYKDAYRVAHPDPVKCPGFTFPADNKDAAANVLSWAVDADERERIDFVYYYPNDKLQVKTAQVAGPAGCIVKGVRQTDTTEDSFVLPVNNQWPSDHKGVLITFSITL